MPGLPSWHSVVTPFLQTFYLFGLRAGSTPLHVATFYGHAGTVEVLQAFGADSLYKNQHGWTAGHYAGRWSQPLGKEYSKCSKVFSQGIHQNWKLNSYNFGKFTEHFRIHFS